MRLSDQNQFLRESYRLNAMLLLKCNDNLAFMKSSVDELYRIASYITDVRIEQIGNDKDIMLPSGKAISTASAAHCLLEMKRTAIFLRGIYKAIIAKLIRIRNHPVRILYVGPGPYGSLLTPVLHLFAEDDIIVDIIEINEASLSALGRLTDALDLNEYIEHRYCADAATFKTTKPYDIVITETMLACLKSEPQVAIMQNLIPQQKKSCTFIPEEISIDAALTNPEMEMKRLMYYENEAPLFERLSLGNVFKLNKLSMDDILSRKRLLIPDEIDKFPILKLITTMRVFKDEVLTDNDSSITMPRQYFNFEEQPAREVEFWYTQGEDPVLEGRITQAMPLTRAVEVEGQ